jgi:rhodanese-related sulfurtransferase
MRLPVLLAAAWLLCGAAVAEPLSARAAQQALQRGALAWDVRDEGAVLPGALRLDAAALRRWAQQGDLGALQQAASVAGLDLSRDVVVYGAAADRRAEAVVTALSKVVTGRLHWLVGGIDEWQALGLPTQVDPSSRLPVPQRLVPGPDGGSMADAARRDVPARDARLALQR